MVTRIPEDALIATFNQVQDQLRAATFPALVEEEVTDDGETFMALRCPRCDRIISDEEVFAVSPAEQWAPNEDPDDDAFDHHRLTFNGSDRPDLQDTLYYSHGDNPGHGVDLPEGWKEAWS